MILRGFHRRNLEVAAQRFYVGVLAPFLKRLGIFLSGDNPVTPEESKVPLGVASS